MCNLYSSTHLSFPLTWTLLLLFSYKRHVSYSHVIGRVQNELNWLSLCLVKMLIMSAYSCITVISLKKCKQCHWEKKKNHQSPWMTKTQGKIVILEQRRTCNGTWQKLSCITVHKIVTELILKFFYSLKYFISYDSGFPLSLFFWLSFSLEFLI